MHYFFAENKEGDLLFISEKEVLNHIKVLRIKKEEEILVNFHGEGFVCFLEDFSKKKATFKIIREYNFPEKNVEIILVQGFPKKKKFEYILEKGTELGISQFIPVNTKFSNQKYEENKMKRWESIVLNASMQCKSKKIPEIRDILELEDIKPLCDLNIVLYEKENNSIKDVIYENKDINSVMVIIGPEGGFSEDEIVLLEEKGFISVKIPGNILRTETAGIITAGILNYEYES